MSCVTFFEPLDPPMRTAVESFRVKTREEAEIEHLAAAAENPEKAAAIRGRAERVEAKRRSKLLPFEQKRRDKEKSILWAPKCICVLSHWPFFRPFRRWLVHLYALSLSLHPPTVPGIGRTAAASAAAAEGAGAGDNNNMAHLG